MRHLLTLLLLLLSLPLPAQRHQLLSPDIRSLQVVANGDWQSLPIVELGKGSIAFAFDDLTHEYRRYLYRLEHCEADWSTSESLFESDYCQGFADGNTIDDMQQSLLTNTLYTHYHLQLPNPQCRITMSGNYRLTVYDDNNEEEPVLIACFMVVEPLMGISLMASPDTDTDIRGSHQQVSMAIHYNGLRVTAPQEQLTTVVMQNRRWDDARWNPQPQYIMPDQLRYEHNRELIFHAGNEYRKFEILSTDVASMGIDRLRWDGSDAHAYPFPALPRLNYLYDEDANGAFLLRNSDNSEADILSDYLQVHFQLPCPAPLDYDIYVNGDFTYDSFLPSYQMHYDPALPGYEAVIPLKLGYYSYQLLMLDGNRQPCPLPSEGSFYQTENSYQALVYYRQPGARTDRLVGYQQITTK